MSLVYLVSSTPEARQPCSEDAECTAAANGQCRPPLGTAEPAVCAYAGIDRGEGCNSDAECTVLPDGRCNETIFGLECRYNECAIDADCAPGFRCNCSDVARCLPAECSGDSDCTPGFACAALPPLECGNVRPPVGYYCHGPADQCQSGANGVPCSFDPARGAWLPGSMCYAP
jgi:hypothetical protein